MPFNQPLAGLIEPAAASWRVATAKDRLAFYEEAGERAVKEKRRELMIAIGANGRRMKPRKYGRRDGANGPIMDPHDELSRTYRLLDYRDWAGGVTLFWHAGVNRKGQRLPWGTILGFHARGAGFLPVRDVRLSKRGIGVVRRAMDKWWDKLVRSRPMPEPTEAGKSNESKPGFFGKLKGAAVRAFGRFKRAITGGNKPNPTPTGNPIADRYPNLKPYLRDKDGKPLG